MKDYKVLLADDHSLVREGVASIINSLEGYEVCGFASNGPEAIEAAKLKQPDIILMDITMGDDINGLQASKEIKETNPDIKIVILSMNLSEQYLSEVIKLGLEGYMVKGMDKMDLIEGLKKVRDGGRYYQGEVGDKMIETMAMMARGEGLTPKNERLSEREMEVLVYIAKGVPNPQIADQLFISPRTVDAHRSNIMKKMEFNSTADLVKYAVKNKLIEL